MKIEKEKKFQRNKLLARPDDINEEIRKLMKLSKEDQFSSKENKFCLLALWLAVINSLATQIER